MTKEFYILFVGVFMMGCDAPIIGEWAGKTSDANVLFCYNYGESSNTGNLNIPIVSPAADDALLKTLDLNIIDEKSGSITLEGITEVDDSSTLTTESIRLHSFDEYSRRYYNISLSESIKIGQNCYITELSCEMSQLNEIACSQELQYSWTQTILHRLTFERIN